MNYFWALIFTLFLSSCVVEKGDVKVDIKKNNKNSQISSANVSAISIVNNKIIVSGNNLGVVSGLKINGLAFNELFTIESKSANQIVANANRAFSFDVSKIFELVLSDAHGSVAFPISFDLPNASVTAPKLNSMGALAGQVLKYDGAAWVASTLSNSQIYLGTYDATLNVPDLNITSPISGDYYIVTTAGAFNAINYEVGDWIMHNGSVWEKISNSSNVVSSFNGRRGIVVPANGDYSWTMLTTASGKLTGSTLGSIADIDLTGIGNNKVLKWDATNLKWIMGDDLSGGGAGTVTSTEISDDTIINADINSAAAIDYSKLNIPAGAIPYSKLTVADNEIPAIKVNGLSSAISGLLTATVADADTTHAPSGDAVFDALGLKLNLAGGTLTPGGTIAGLPALPLAGSEATSKDYVDAQITTVSTSANGKVSKAGDTMTGILTLDSDLKMKGGTKYVSLKVDATMAADYNLTLPVSGGTAGYVLSTDGVGVTSWINPAVNSTSITDGSIVNADVAAAANIDATKLATGVIENTEFDYLNGVTSAIQTQLDNKQALDATLTSLAGFNTNGIMVQTAADTFVGRTIAGTANRLIVTDGNGVAGNPTIDIPAALLPSPNVGDVGKFLKATAADTALWSALTALDVTTALTYTPVNKAGDTLSTGTLTVNGTAHISLPAPTLLTDPTTKDYVDTQIAGASNQWEQSAGNVYRSIGNVGIGTSTPGRQFTVSGASYPLISVQSSGANGGVLELTSNGDNVTGKNIALFNQAGDFRLRPYNAVDPSGITVLQTSGNVGIGLINPSTRLEVLTSTTTDGAFNKAITVGTSVSGGQGGWIGSRTSSANQRQGLMLSSAQTLTLHGDNAGDGSSVLDIIGGSTPDTVGDTNLLMRVNSNGNVGIGTATPASLLHVNGSIRAQELCDLTGGNCKSIASGWGNVSAATMIANWPDAIVCDNGTDKSIMYHDTRDNAANLEYYGKASGTHWIRFNATTGAFYDATALAGGSICSGKSISTLVAEGRTFGLLGGGVDWTTNGTDVYRSGGKVGIGTSAPLAKLDLRDAINRSIQITPSVDNTASGVSKIEFRHNDNGNVNALYASIQAPLINGGLGFNAGELAFYTAPQAAGNPAALERLRITNAGNVGIGTVTPGEKLEVAGNIKLSGGGTIVQEAWITPSLLNGWLDFTTSGDTNWGPIAYYKGTDGRVYLKGLVRAGTCGTPIFTLPAGYRPAKYRTFPSVSMDLFVRVNIASNGDVIAAAGCNNVWVSLDGISFRVVGD